jgi:hypothetical protein
MLSSYQRSNAISSIDVSPAINTTMLSSDQHSNLNDLNWK